MSLMLVYNELVISMGVVFPINSVLNIPSIFVEPNFGMTYLSTKIPQTKHVSLRLDMAISRRNTHSEMLFTWLPLLYIIQTN